MSAYKCPACGCGRFHAKGCSEVPAEFADQCFDEAHRMPGLGAETVRIMENARRLCGQPPLTETERVALSTPVPAHACGMKPAKASTEAPPSTPPTE